MENCKDFYEFQVQRNASRLSRGLLMMLEDLQTQQELNQEGLLKILPSQYHELIKLSNVLTDEKMRHLRKRILDHTNGHVRDILGDLQNFQLEFKFNSQ